MKLFVYYSNSGNGDYVANIMKDKGFDILKIEPVKDLPKNFYLKILVGGFSALIKEKPKLKNNLSVLNNYSEIYVGTPVWNNRISCPINTVIDVLKNKKFNLICYSGSGKSKGVVDQLKNYKVETIISLTEPLKYKEEAKVVLDKYIK